MFYIKKILLFTAIFILTGCATDIISVDNNEPNTKIIIEKNPDQSTFYSDTYKTVSQRLYDDNVRIEYLSLGTNKIEIDDSVPKYAIYFILQRTSEKNSQNWKYLITTDKSNSFIIDKDKIIKS